MKKSVFVVCLLSLWLTTAWSSDQEYRLSLQQAMRIALENNFAIQNQRIAISISDTQNRGSYGIYDYHLDNEFSFSLQESEQFSPFEASEQGNQSISSSISRLMNTGGFIELEAGFERTTGDAIFNSLSPRYSTALTARFSQPLLKGAGTDITETKIIITGLQSKAARAQIKLQAHSLLTRVEQIYWNLVIAHDQLKVAEQTLDLFNQNLDDTMIRREAGEAAKIAEVQARQRVAQAKSDLVDAQGIVDRLEDQLKNLIVGLDWSVNIVPEDSLPASIQPSDNLEELVSKAVADRPEFELLNIEKNISQVNTTLAEDKTRPELNLFAEAQIAGISGEFQPNFISQVSPFPDRTEIADSFGNLLDFDNGGIAVGARYSFNLDNTAAEAELEVSKLRQKQIEIRRKEIKHQVSTEIRDALREMEIARNQILSREAAVELAQAEYEAEKDRLEAGESTEFLTLEALVQLNQAQVQLIRAKASMATALVSYKRAVGSTLSASGISMDFIPDTNNLPKEPTP